MQVGEPVHRKITKTVGRVVNGALVERELPHKFNAKGELVFALKKQILRLHEEFHRQSIMN